MPASLPRPTAENSVVPAANEAIDNGNTPTNNTAKKHARPRERGVRYYGSPANTKGGKNKGTAKKAVTVP